MFVKMMMCGYCSRLTLPFAQAANRKAISPTCADLSQIEPSLRAGNEPERQAGSVAPRQVGIPFDHQVILSAAH